MLRKPSESHVNTPFYVSSSLVETKRHDVAINDMINGTWPRKDTRSQSATETQRNFSSFCEAFSLVHIL